MPKSEDEDEEYYYRGTELNLEVDGDNLIGDITTYKIGNSFKVVGDAGSLIGGGITLGVGISRGIISTGEAAVEGTALLCCSCFDSTLSADSLHVCAPDLEERRH